MNAVRLRVAVIGAGWWGAQHARVFAERDDTELCAIVARRPETAEARVGQYGAAGYTDIEVMLEAEHPDFVTLSLPNTEHYEPTLTVLRAGYPVLARSRSCST